MFQDTSLFLDHFNNLYFWIILNYVFQLLVLGIICLSYLTVVYLKQTYIRILENNYFLMF